MPLATIHGTQINYRFDGPGDGPVVLFSNSLASNLTMWDLQIAALTERGYRVLRYDSRGHGQSAVAEGPYSIAMLTSDVVRLMDAFGLHKVHFCGLSLGGMVGQMLGAMHGDRLISLTLCSTTAYMALKESWDERIESAQKNGMRAAVEATVDRWLTKASQERLPDEVEKIGHMIINTAVDGYCASGIATQTMDLRETIRTISVPTLVLVGEHDPSTPVAAAEFIHEGITSSELHIIPDAAHVLDIEQDRKFNEVFLEFLNRNIE